MAKRNPNVVEHQPNQPAQGQAVPNKGHDVGERGDKLRAIMLDAAKIGNTQEAQNGQISQRLLAIAATVQESANTKDVITGQRNPEFSAKFIEMCKFEEKFIKSNEAGAAKRDTLPRCWTQAKSNIKAAMEFGIDLNRADFRSEHAVRKAVVKARGLKDATDNRTDAEKLADNIRTKLLAIENSKDLADETKAQAIQQMQEAFEILDALLPDAPVKDDTQKKAA